jgi:hypothetical protein
MVWNKELGMFLTASFELSFNGIEMRGILPTGRIGRPSRSFLQRPHTGDPLGLARPERHMRSLSNGQIVEITMASRVTSLDGLKKHYWRQIGLGAINSSCIPVPSNQLR